ncbi:hypothetical protein J4Q44_G00195340, partial [Coregonus suidteri]
MSKPCRFPTSKKKTKTSVTRCLLVVEHKALDRGPEPPLLIHIHSSLHPSIPPPDCFRLHLALSFTVPPEKWQADCLTLYHSERGGEGRSTSVATQYS